MCRGVPEVGCLQNVCAGVFQRSAVYKMCVQAVYKMCVQAVYKMSVQAVYKMCVQAVYKMCLQQASSRLAWKVMPTTKGAVRNSLYFD